MLDVNIKVENAKPQTNLYSLTFDDLKEFCLSIGEKPYRATQIMKWLYHKGVRSIDEMTDVSKKTREKLKEITTLSLPEVVLDHLSEDGTRKWLIRLDSGNSIEMVYIPEDDRGTLCVSSQVGCALDCSFCATGKQGFNRNLAVEEIVGQLMIAKLLLNDFEEIDNFTPRKVTNVVFMGMGEPLLNYRNVVSAMKIMLDDYGFGLSKRRVTLSTSGVVPALYRLKEDIDVALAISLHAPYNTLRDELVPINQKYPINELLDACRNYIDGTNKKITWEYVLLRGVNDRDEDAHALARLIRNIPGKVNLIPFNPFDGVDYQTSDRKQIDHFRSILMGYGLVAVTRKTRGDDVDAACGQLAGRVKDRTKRTISQEGVGQEVDQTKLTQETLMTELA
ncbi:23S rRNA (adenine(2503)-C(2))-methyltransferase RlmN [Ignatzschineria ureiclastica]|uniref:Dual-specificity RNA methyltransferase RlmN n=1 Tax=Ignatzschineria ureiclastica TaxID=472582 RepID=A0A2U2AGX0_9GAMM|nr:23S rRNA (adenine(2503)-C(2))-methyltransferase RlmN [Ignatzschineria ureiclastica]PWD81898.1 23S rRNA (adenine(2503)-C(2))-methyltransferase RlmN [Ignatzschineria ureiclastica]GGZ91303.1 dual-specificity RNA methyltransferase RlmN [Ignatzschineria ureiclastica]